MTNNAAAFPTTKPPSRTERSRIAWELRQTGITLREVGEHLGVRTERARQLVSNYERVLEWRKKNPDAKPEGPYLSVRAYNALRYAGLKDSQPEEIARFGAKAFLKIPNMGKVSLQEIAVWLREQGYELAD